MLLFRKVLLTLEGVLADVCGDERAGIRILDSVLLANFVRHFVEEWPQRLHQPPQFRDFATQLSSEDLASLYWTSPAMLTRYWSSMWRDILKHLSIA
jgi:hypothetical protein